MFFVLALILSSCKVENLSKDNIPKSDFSKYNYVIATEDASSEDITTFFAFNLSQMIPDKKYDLFTEEDLFINSNPSTSSGHFSMNQYLFSLAKDKQGYSSTPGLFRLTLNVDNRMYIEDNLSISKNNLFPARQLCIVNEHLGYFYDEGKDAYKIKIFDPTQMILTGKIDLEPAVKAFRPDATWVDESGNNLVRTGSLVLDANQGKLYVSIVFLEKAGFNLISETETSFYLAVVDINSQQVEKIISYYGVKTVGFFVSENKSTTVDENGNMYFCSWGWNQFNEGNPSKVFRIKSGETDFDTNWSIDIESAIGSQRVAQSMISYKGKIYLHVSEGAYGFLDSDQSPGAVTMSYYEFDPANPGVAKKLNIPSSNASPRINVFNIIDDKLFIAVPNIEQSKFNGFYSVDDNGDVKKEITLANKYRPTRLYKLHK
ncbi:MAG: hypothetical protein H3C31_10765 [Brumimicrobium sp.]|nr:hypothetical protein [Brumimicrobium sp.]